MAYKQHFHDFMREFTENHPDEDIDQLTPEQLSDRTGYSLSRARDYLDFLARSKTDAYIRAQESGAVTFVTSSGKATVVYYPRLGEVQITSTYTRKRLPRYYNEQSPLLLAPQDTLEIGIYLLGLQPHIREVLARKEMPVSQAVPEVEQEDAQLDGTDQDI